MKDMGLGWDKAALAILWDTLFICLLINDTTYLGLLDKRLLHSDTKSPNLLHGTLGAWRVATKVLLSISNITLRKSLDIAILRV